MAQLVVSFNSKDYVVANRQTGSRRGHPIYSTEMVAPSQESINTSGLPRLTTQRNRVLIVGVGTGGADPSGITYNSVPMTRFGGNNRNTTYSSLWYLIAPATGSNDIVVSLGSSARILCGGTSFYNINQSGPISNVAQDNGVSKTSSSVNVTTVVNSIAVDVCHHDKNETTAVGAGQTELFDVQQATGSANGSSERATTTTTAMSHSWSTSGEMSATKPWPYCGMNLMGLSPSSPALMREPSGLTKR
jgi:hypothetical protein